MRAAQLARLMGRQLRASLRMFGADATVAKADDLTEVSGVRCALGRRRPEDLTAGLDLTEKMAKVMADEWDAKVGRAPMKGDVITLRGVRYGVLHASREGLNGAAAVYVIDVGG